jgi:hypothetical protein
VNPNRARQWRPCSGDGGHRRRGPRAGTSSAAYGGSVAPLVEDGDGRNGGVRQGPETAAEGSTATTMFRQ